MRALIVNSKPYDEDEVYRTLKKYKITSTSIPSKADFVIAIGGDSAVLQCVDTLKHIIAINTGTLGFLSNDLTLDEMINCYVNTGDFIIDRRQLNTVGNNKDSYATPFLNEVSLLSPTPGKLLNVDLFINKELVTTYKGDGLIISTATGSTAWNLSAGGSIIDPSVECLMITPNNPFSMNHKPLVVDLKSRIKVNGTSCLIVDGDNKGICDTINIRYDHRTLNLVRPKGTGSFYKRIQNKLGWGETIKQ